MDERYSEIVERHRRRINSEKISGGYVIRHYGKRTVEDAGPYRLVRNSNKSVGEGLAPPAYKIFAKQTGDRWSPLH